MEAMTTPSARYHRELLAHAAWVRRLAGRLTAHPHAAEDRPIDLDRDLHGRVVNEAGEAVAGARLAVLSCAVRQLPDLAPAGSSPRTGLLAETELDSEGRFRVRLGAARLRTRG